MGQMPRSWLEAEEAFHLGGVEFETPRVVQVEACGRQGTLGMVWRTVGGRSIS